MSLEPERPTAQILDFEEFRRKRHATPASIRRQFLWSWPTSGQSWLVQFPPPAPAAAPVRSRFL